MGLGLVTRIRSLSEAHIAAGALRSAGIAAEVFDTSFGGMESPVIEGLGGYRLMAPEAQIPDARAFLRALRSSPGLDEPEEPGPWSPPPPRAAPTQHRAMRTLALVLLGIPLLFWLLRLLAAQ